MEILSRHHCFGGTLGYYTHMAESTRCAMRFTVFVPPQAEDGRKLATLFFLSGLTCTEENFTVKAGAYRTAADLGLIIVNPDTSPRGPDIFFNEEGNLGQGASYYIDACQAPWNEHFRMETYITRELHALVMNEFPADEKRTGIMGHSMGGHGALTLVQKYPRQYRSVSAMAPVCAAARSPGGLNAFLHYLGDEPKTWYEHDATALLLSRGKIPHTIFIDQGSEDSFRQHLHLDLFEEACAKVEQSCTIRRQPGYDHSYFFVQSFIADHLRHHATALSF